MTFPETTFVGGRILDYLAETKETVFTEHQLYRLVSYGCTQTAIWHLGLNAYALWQVESYLERAIGTLRLMFVYHTGLIAAGFFFLVIYPDGLGFGASHAIFACPGLPANWLVRDRSLWTELKKQRGFRFLIGFLIQKRGIDLQS